MTSGIAFGLSTKSSVSEYLISLEPWRASFTRPDEALLSMANRRFVLDKGGQRFIEIGGRGRVEEDVSLILERIAASACDSFCFVSTSY